MTKANSAEIVFVLDRSGSMDSIKKDMIGGFAEFVRKQREIPGDCKVTLVQFDTEYEVVYSGKDLADVPPLNLDPRGMTALLDGIGTAVNTTGERLRKMAEHERPSKVFVVIITDGLENASKEFTSAKIAQMIKHQRESYAWDFVFIGADESALRVARDMGINNAAKFNSTERGARAVYRSAGLAVATSRVGGQSLNYSQKSYDAALAKEDEGDK